MRNNWRPPDLSGRVAVVAGATRGVGRGIAEVLGTCGAVVYVTGRSTRSLPDINRDRTVEAVADAIIENGGAAHAVVCDHRDDREVEQLFERVAHEHGGFDILVNNHVGWSDHPEDTFKRRRLWQRPISWWNDNFDAGVRGHVVNCHYGIPLMLGREHAIAIFTGERTSRDNVDAWDAVLDLRATVTERMVALLASQLRSKGVPAILLYPGWTRTEDQMEMFNPASAAEERIAWEEYSEKTVSPHYAGRAAAMLSADPNVMELTGSIQSSYELAKRYDFNDVDGRRPNPT